jgi:predicted RNA-binding protein YlqC (UPF0109 family)
MVVDFIKEYAKLIVVEPDFIEVEQRQLDENYYEIIIYAGEKDLGKLIGKDGNMINALKTIINGCKAKDNNFYKIQVLKNER